MHPMVRIDDKSVDRTLFWASCLFATDCPPEGVRGHELRAAFTVDADIASFNRDAFIAALVSTLAPVGTDLEGTVTPGDIELFVSGGSLLVEARITIVSNGLRSALTSQINALTPEAASSALGVTVTALEPVEVVQLSFAPPTPPPTPAMPPPSRRLLADVPLVAIIVGAICGGVCLLAVPIGILMCCWQRQRQQQKANARDPAKSVTINVEPTPENKPQPPA